MNYDGRGGWFTFLHAPHYVGPVPSSRVFTSRRRRLGSDTWSSTSPVLLASGWGGSREREGSLTWVLTGGGAEFFVDGGVLLELRGDVAAV